jgi:hypothetical protein
MQLVGTDTHDSTHAIGPAAGETGRGIDQNRTGIDTSNELPRCGDAIGNDAVRMAGTVGIDVLDGFGYAVDNPNREDSVQVFGTSDLFGGRLDVGQYHASAFDQAFTAARHWSQAVNPFVAKLPSCGSYLACTLRCWMIA